MNKLAASLMALSLCLGACTGSHVIPAAKPAAPPTPNPKPTGQALAPETYLRKLSLHIRGLTPSRTDYDDLAQAIANKTSDDFFRKKTEAYLASDEHIDKMTLRLEELFLVKPSDLPSGAAPVDTDMISDFKDMPDDYTIHNSMNQMFRDIAARNLSWDTLLTGKKYRAYPIINTGFFQDLSDPMFLSSAAKVPAVLTKPLDVAFDDDDNRVAGSISTSRFFNRYGNTALNKNRRRAAAIFRIFLCDDMKAVVVDEAGNQDGILDKVFPAPKGGGTERGGLSGSDRHGTDPACMKCHSKLDPMGLTFQASGLELSPLASPGALVYTTADGHEVNVHGSGLGDVAKSITKQREYVRCQVSHFWNWYIGADTPLDEATMTELTSKFDQVDRRTNDFITYLVNRPEFGSYSSRSPEQELAAEVKGVLQNCNGCHAAAKKGIPSFTDWPIGGSLATHNQQLAKIRSALALDGAGKPRWMPPASSAWQPDAAQLDVMKRWFDAGSPMGFTAEVKSASR